MIQRLPALTSLGVGMVAGFYTFKFFKPLDQAWNPVVKVYTIGVVQPAVTDLLVDNKLIK